MGPDGSLYYLSIGSGEVHQVQHLNHGLLQGAREPFNLIFPEHLKEKFHKTAKNDQKDLNIWNFGMSKTDDDREHALDLIRPGPESLGGIIRGLFG